MSEGDLDEYLRKNEIYMDVIYHMGGGYLILHASSLGPDSLGRDTV